MPTPASNACNTFSKNIATRKCLVVGGLKTRMWVFQLADFTGVETTNADGSLSSFGLAAGASVITCTGRPKKGKGDNKIAQAVDAAVSVDQALSGEVGYGNQDELNALMDFLRADAKTVFVETNSGNIRQYFHEFGTDSLEGTDGSGALLSDTGVDILSFTLKGTCANLPRFFKAAITGQQTQLAASRAYLDALVTGVATV